MTDSLPARLTAGDTWAFCLPDDLSQYASPSWTMRAVLSPRSGGVPLSINASFDGARWNVLAPASETSSLFPGEWSCVAVWTSQDGLDRHTATVGSFTVAPDPVTFTGDSRSKSARILAAIEAAIEGRATKDADAFTIEGRSITRTPIADLIRLRNIYRAEVAAERGRTAPFKVRRVTH